MSKKKNGLASIERRQGAASQVHQILRQALLQSNFEPGERLVETQLAEMLGVSRTPVREALSKLENEGLVEPSRSGGVLVRDITSELIEIYGLRQRLEGYAAALAAKRITSEELEALDAVRREAMLLRGQPNLEERVTLNNRFHMLVTEASRSPRLIQLVSDYRDYFLNAQFMLYYDKTNGARQHRQHAEIVEALRGGDAALAERLVWDHFERALAVIQRGLQRSREETAAGDDGRGHQSE